MQNKKIIIIGTTASNLYIFRKDFIAACIVKIDVVVFVSEYTAEWIDKLSELGADVVTYKLSRGWLKSVCGYSNNYGTDQ